MTVLRDFYEYVCAHDHENTWLFLLSGKYFEETENVRILTLPEVKKSGLRKLWFDFVTGRLYINSLAPDVVLSLQNIITFGVKVPQLVYIHQSIPFQATKRFSFLRSSERKLAVIQHLIGAIIKKSARNSDRIIVQTQWMKDAVCRLCRLPEEKVLVSLPIVRQDWPEFVGEVLQKTEFFYPAAELLYKNHDCLRKASALLEKRGVAHTITLTLPQERSSGCIVCTGQLPYEDVISRYRRATLVFPSYIETFGYPLAEARQAGTIVLAADTPFAREVLDGYENAYYFDPFKPEELADLMEKVIRGELVCRPAEQKQKQERNCWQEVTGWIRSCGSEKP